ncbi:lymphotactin-like isoform X2 [Lissotriton helveticus]
MKILFFLMLAACVLESQVEGIGGQIVRKTTCKKLVDKKQIPARNIQSYKVLNNSTKEVILTLKDGRKSCEDPNLDWVKKVMAQVDKREKQKKRRGSKKLRNKSKKN